VFYSVLDCVTATVVEHATVLHFFDYVKVVWKSNKNNERIYV